MQLVSWRRFEVSYLSSCFDHPQLAPCDFNYVRRESGWADPVEHAFRGRVSKATDHASSLHLTYQASIRSAIRIVSRTDTNDRRSTVDAPSRVVAATYFFFRRKRSLLGVWPSPIRRYADAHLRPVPTVFSPLYTAHPERRTSGSFSHTANFISFSLNRDQPSAYQMC